MQWGDLFEAADILKELLAKFPDESELRIMLSEIYTELDQDEAAIDELNQIGTDDDSYVQALLQLADLYQAQGLYEVAEQKLLTAKHLQPSEMVIDFALAELYYSIGEYNHAITYYERLDTKEEIAHVSIMERLAESYAAAGKYEEALQFYKEAKSKNPDVLFKYGVTAQQAKRSDIAIHTWEEVLKIDPYYHTVYYPLAKAYEAEELLEKAYTTAKKGIEVDEFNKELYYYTARLAEKMGNDQESEKWVKKAISLDADYKEAVLFLIALLKKNDDAQKIIDLIHEIQQSGAEDPSYDWEIGRAYYEIEAYDDALKHYQRAYINLKDDSEFLKEYGYFLSEEGRKKEAIQVFTAYLNIVPTDIETQEYMMRLQQVE
ncbi:tetratricopeptide repeat protein [Virgibacillus sp. 179-BFC.A HS]|uniref:Tetratricopeptide repeat protein n=1 Tax=Tigheibacillus jepli TaxID=3035914 RepID=A0ABU5CHD1_9BACI|nr:tetratricopeptide repeat protein [Virgibacillus sp. 179-BFC.A HS]MDY0405706.1 tetratricopeptide repeat protein [Virgibacillus sp. 179-BFC.A HS]